MLVAISAVLVVTFEVKVPSAAKALIVSVAMVVALVAIPVTSIAAISMVLFPMAVLSELVIITPLPELVTSLKSVTLLVVYIPSLTVAALPETFPIIVEEKVLTPPIVSSPVFITAPVAETLANVILASEPSFP